MASIPGIPVTGSIVPTDTSDTFATHESQYGLGGWKTVSNLTERDNIPTQRREEGMVVYVLSESRSYVLKGGVTNSNWEDYLAGQFFDAVVPDQYSDIYAAINDGKQRIFYKDNTAVSGSLVSSGGNQIYIFGESLNPLYVDITLEAANTQQATSIHLENLQLEGPGLRIGGGIFTSPNVERIDSLSIKNCTVHQDVHSGRPHFIEVSKSSSVKAENIQHTLLNTTSEKRSFIHAVDGVKDIGVQSVYLEKFNVTSSVSFPEFWVFSSQAGRGGSVTLKDIELRNSGLIWYKNDSGPSHNFEVRNIRLGELTTAISTNAGKYLILFESEGGNVSGIFENIFVDQNAVDYALWFNAESGLPEPTIDNIISNATFNSCNLVLGDTYTTNTIPLSVMRRTSFNNSRLSSEETLVSGGLTFTVDQIREVSIRDSEIRYGSGSSFILDQVLRLQFENCDLVNNSSEQQVLELQRPNQVVFSQCRILDTKVLVGDTTANTVGNNLVFNNCNIIQLEIESNAGPNPGDPSTDLNSVHLMGCEIIGAVDRDSVVFSANSNGTIKDIFINNCHLIDTSTGSPSGSHHLILFDSTADTIDRGIITGCTVVNTNTNRPDDMISASPSITSTNIRYGHNITDVAGSATAYDNVSSF